MSSVEQPVLYMKVTEALRAPGPSNIAELAKTYNIAEYPNLLLLAVDLSPLETVQWITKLYEQKARDFNEQDPTTGNTALHIAVMANRTTVIRHLMEMVTVDDTVRNKKGVTALDLVQGADMEAVLAQAEAKFSEKTALRLKRAFKARDIRELEHIYANRRVSEVLQINGFDPETQRTVLHDAAQANDLPLVQFILAHGGDPLIRDALNHKLPQDLTTSEEIRAQLIQAAKSKAILDQTNSSGSNGAATKGKQPCMEGYLKKWTNITSGYKLRWFRLSNGELSYYKKPEDVKAGDRQIRGSIGLRLASVRLDSSEKNKFEIRTPSTKFHLKATHPAETNKWVWALQNAITLARDLDKKSKKGHASTPSSGSVSKGVSGRHTGPVGSSSTSPNAPHRRSTSSVGGGAATAASAATPAAPAAAAAPAATTSIGGRPEKPPLELQPPQDPSRSQAPSPSSPTLLSPSLQSPNPFHIRNTSTSSQNGWFVNDLIQKGDDNYESDDDDEDELVLHGPHISAESLIGRLSAIKNLIGMLVFQVQDEAMRDAITTTQGSIDVVSADIVMLQRQARAQLRKTEIELEKSENGQRVWASNYRDLEIQYEKLEGKVHTLKAEAGTPDSDEDEFFDTIDNAPVQQHQRPQRQLSPSEQHAEQHEGGSKSHNTGEQGLEKQVVNIHEDEKSSEVNQTNSQQGVTDGASRGAAGAGAATYASSERAKDATGDSGDLPAPGSDSGAGSDSGSRQLEDENPPVPEYAVKPPGDDKSQYGRPVKMRQTDHSVLTDAQKQVENQILKEKSFAGYQDGPRQKLSIDADNRPSISLWGILKNLIGRDMTKMTLPVTFNECTSLLQRSAEDMEYTELLDKASEAVDDPGLRMVYVAAFAGSSYCSTINRVAKPFNPLLGETYEYTRPDKGYRLFAEQVSHHPPIGAVVANSENWDFYGESNVESKFYGRSFDINPLGLWYLNLRPDKGAKEAEEVYSFRKITSSVVGIMVGNPVVDNYGNMEITNHTLGIKAIIQYKARGWRGSSAYKLQGKITDKDGKELWTLAGQWNNKMYGMKAGSNTKIELWEAHKRNRTPFNLTDFAVTLNALPDSLRAWLPPTDTRFRPDQRAMEQGRYNDASEEKNRVEEKQRAARREREAKGIEYKPLWFELAAHPVTGKKYYKPVNDYWAKRANHDFGECPHIF